MFDDKKTGCNRTDIHLQFRPGFGILPSERYSQATRHALKVFEELSNNLGHASNFRPADNAFSIKLRASI
eukprot:182441-Pleurochrysis_carterae.AAC.1